MAAEDFSIFLQPVSLWKCLRHYSLQCRESEILTPSVSGSTLRDALIRLILAEFFFLFFFSPNAHPFGSNILGETIWPHNFGSGHTLRVCVCVCVCVCGGDAVMQSISTCLNAALSRIFWIMEKKIKSTPYVTFKLQRNSLLFLYATVAYNMLYKYLPKILNSSDNSSVHSLCNM